MRRVPLPLRRERRDDPPPKVAGIERTMAMEVGMVAVEVRPTRIFLRVGRQRQLVRVVPLSATPRPLKRPRRARGLHLGPVRVSTVGSPVVTVALAGANAMVRSARGRR